MDSTEERLHQLRATAALLRAYRRRQHVSQYRLAKIADVHHSHIARVELAERRLSVEYLDRIATALELDDAEHDALRIAAGYAPTSGTSQLLMAQILREPAVLALLHLLRDTTLPEAATENVRQGLAALVATVRAMQTVAE